MKGVQLRRRILSNWVLYLFLAPAIAYIFLFNYVPIYGVQLAFKDFAASKGIWGSPWAGLKHFRELFGSPVFSRLINNILTLSLYGLAAGFPIPILLALMLNSVPNRRFKKIVQNITYAPYFISTVVLCGMVILFLSPSSGVINSVIKLTGGKPVNFMQNAKLFPAIHVWSDVWKQTGWASIIYLSALAGISPELHEAATVDGANKLQRVFHIDIPGLMPTIVVMLMLSLGRLMNVGFEKIYLLQNSINLSKSEVISTYVYKVGMLNAQYSFSTAVSLFNNVINIVMLVAANFLVKRLGQQGLW